MIQPTYISPHQFSIPSPNDGATVGGGVSVNNSDINNDMLKKYQSKIRVMARLCDLSGGHFAGIKNKTVLPLIIINAALVILNALSTNIADKEIQTRVSYVNICLNAISFIIINYLNQFKIAEKAQSFRGSRDDFLKLLHSVDTAENGNSLNNQFLSTLIDKYDSLVSSVPSIPGNIKSKVSNEFQNEKSLPVMLTATVVQTVPMTKKV